MICQRCGQEQASVHFTEVVGGEKRQRRLCPGCAQTEGIYVNLSFSAAADPLSSTLSQGIEAKVKAKEAEAWASRIRCERCECTLAQIRRSGRVGCPECYDVFFEHLAPLLDHVHGCREHLSRENPGGDDLAFALKAAITREDFAEAARLRDEIRRRSGGEAEGAGP